jgi:hypothetical protein
LELEPGEPRDWVVLPKEDIVGGGVQRVFIIGDEIVGEEDPVLLYDDVSWARGKLLCDWLNSGLPIGGLADIALLE